MANGMTIDAIDIHDGFSLCKGHAGAAVVPACLATAEISPEPIDGRELLTSLAIGYEVAFARGCVCMARRRPITVPGRGKRELASPPSRPDDCGSRRIKNWHALAIAEYHGPRLPYALRQHPTMLKDGSGWGDDAGVTSAQLAAAGLTGRPAETVESPAAAHTGRTSVRGLAISGNVLQTARPSAAGRSRRSRRPCNCSDSIALPPPTSPVSGSSRFTRRPAWEPAGRRRATSTVQPPVLGGRGSRPRHAGTGPTDGRNRAARRPGRPADRLARDGGVPRNWAPAFRSNAGHTSASP